MNEKLNVIWRKEWIFDYESPWSVFEKLALVNFVDRNDILYTLGNDEVKALKSKSNIGDSRRELFKLSGFNDNLLYEVLGYDLKKHNCNLLRNLVDSFSKVSVPFTQWFHKDLHFCEECISKGYHSWFHQYKLLRKCIFHKTPIINMCPSCKKGFRSY